MPELPEVEISCRGIRPHLSGHIIKTILIRQPSLRWPIPADLPSILTGQRIEKIERRAKYILFHCSSGTLIMHLGMSGSLRILTKEEPPQKHDHVDIIMQNGHYLRYRDPRRFGSILWTDKPVLEHKLLINLGPEPLGSVFNGEYLKKKSKQRRVAVKIFIMNAAIVVGVGNIYASEALFAAGIDPRLNANKVSLQRYNTLAEQIKKILKKAIKAGGTTLRDFKKSDGQPGYFKQKLQVYGKTGDQCPVCESTIKQIKLGQRASFYCGNCQR